MKVKSRMITASKAINLGTLPVFVRLIHRHFEKENPLEFSHWGTTAEFEAPLDLLRMSLTDKTLVEDVDGITFTYASKR